MGTPDTPSELMNKKTALWFDYQVKFQKIQNSYLLRNNHWDFGRIRRSLGNGGMHTLLDYQQC